MDYEDHLYNFSPVGSVGFFVLRKNPTGDFWTNCMFSSKNPTQHCYYCVGSVGFCRFCRVFRPAPMDSSSQTRAGRKSVNEERTSPEPVNLTEFATQSCQFICLRAPTQIASNFGRFTDASAGGRQAFLRGQQYNTTFLGRKKCS